MRLSPRQLNRATLGRQLLLRRESMDVVAAVRRVVALQAQQPASPYLALWNRVAGFDPADLDRAYEEGSVVKAHLMRVAIHTVAAADHPALHEAMQTTLRGARLYDRRFTRTGLTSADADALIPELLDFTKRPRTGDELDTWVDERVGELPKPSVWWALRHYAPLVHAPTGGPWSFGPRRSYLAAREAPDASDRDAGMAWLVQRYLEGFGPASAQDVARFGMLYAGLVRDALGSLLAAGRIVQVDGPDRRTLFDVPGGLLPPEDTPAPPRLLPMWDSVLLAYEDRARVIPADHRRLVMRNNGDVLPTLLVDGYVAGVWRPVAGGIEATAFQRLPDEAWSGLEAEARALAAFLAEREPLVYGRYAHWWKRLPRAEVRILAAA